VRLDIPDAVRVAAERLTAKSAPAGWDALPAGRAGVAYGAQWLPARRSAAPVVPSAIVPEAHNILADPHHPDAAGVTATKLRRWLHDPQMGRTTWSLFRSDCIGPAFSFFALVRFLFPQKAGRTFG